MSTEEEKQLDEFIRKMVTDTGLEKPGPDLKNNIMRGLKKRYSRVVYRSLIPRKAWVVLAVSLVVFVGFALYNPLGIGAMNIDLFPWDLGTLFGSVSMITLSAFVIFGVMMLLQVLLLKRRIDQNY